MPWKNEGGGGWQGGGGNKGPWGQGPQGPNGSGRGPGGGGPIPPELDELLRRSKDALKGAIPGGGGRITWLVPLILLLVFATYMSVHQIQADERGVVLRLGKYSRTVTPGLRFAIWPIETMEAVRVESENQTNIGDKPNSGIMLTGDQNLVDIRFNVLWKINDPEDYLFIISEPEMVVSAVVESAMREIVGRTNAERVRTTGKQEVLDQVLDISQKALDNYQSGVLISKITLEKADPPEQVVDKFQEVQRAEQNQANLINEANQYANKKARQAEGESAKLNEDALAYKASVVAGAQGESQRFLKVLEEYAKAKDVTRKRLFLETMEGVLSQSNKIIIEGGKDGSGVVPYLPLPAITNRTEQPAQGVQQ